MANRVRPIVVAEADRQELERLCRASSTRAGLSRRARAVLLMSARAVGGGHRHPDELHRGADQPAAAALCGARGGRADRSAPTGRPPDICARKRAQVVALTLKRPDPGLSHWTAREMARRTGVSAQYRATDLARPCLAAASGGDLQVQHRSARRGEDHRCGGAVPEPPDERGGAERGREDPGPGVESDPTVAAAAPGLPGPADARLPAQWGDQPVRGPGGGDRPRGGRCRPTRTREPTFCISSSTSPGCMAVTGCTSSSTIPRPTPRRPSRPG